MVSQLSTTDKFPLEAQIDQGLSFREGILKHPASISKQRWTGSEYAHVQPDLGVSVCT